MLARFFENSMHNLKPYRLWVGFALMAIGLLFSVFPPIVGAQAAPSAMFSGMGFIDDHSVEDGTVVEAWVRGRPVAATEIFNQGFVLQAAEPPGESFDGEVERFRGLETDTKANWVEGTESWILLYAHTGLEGEGGNKTEVSETEAIRELRARLLALKQERSELGAEFERQSGIDIARVTDRWERTIEELRAEVEQQIQQVKRKFEFERRQITLGPRSEVLLRTLDEELDAFIGNNWAESNLKERYRDNEILEMAQARGFEIFNLNQLIRQLEI